MLLATGAMCSRYRLVKEKIVLTINGREIEVIVRKRYNVAPQQTMPVLIPDLFGGVQAVEMKWGWRPVWSKQLLINAQAETVQEKSTFKKYLGNRCLIPADGFYEWTPDKRPIMFTQKDDAPFCFAGLWLEAAAPSEPAPGPAQKFIILTTTPGEAVARVHNRMPLIVPSAHYGSWFNDDLFPAVLNSPARGELNSCPVQKELNHVRNEGPELLRPASEQKDLF